MKKILIVDDQPEARELVEITLRFDGYQILFAETGPEAIEVAQAKQPDIILLDVNLSEAGMDGLEVCRHLKGDPLTADIYIVILSAKSQKEDIEAGKRAGADYYLCKPFSPVTLIEKVEELVGLSI